jgi:hypothetical protein
MALHISRKFFQVDIHPLLLETLQPLLVALRSPSGKSLENPPGAPSSSWALNAESD